MFCNEAPAATNSGVDGKKSDRLGLEPARRQAVRGCGPISAVAAEIHHGKASEHRPRWLALPSIQEMCQCSIIEKYYLFQCIDCIASH
jgi:hypothetical protein